MVELRCVIDPALCCQEERHEGEIVVTHAFFDEETGGGELDLHYSDGQHERVRTD
jgi:hypothetical protein